MRIAFIFNWDCNMQRPHHWVIEAVKRGHEADVYDTSPRWPWRRLQVSPDYATRIYRAPTRTVERLVHRLVGPHSGIAKRLKSQFTARSAKIWETLWNSPANKRYDAVIFCGPVPCMVRREKWGIPLVYDCMDQWDGFPQANPRALEFEASLAAIADVIWAVTPGLADRLGKRHGVEKCHVLPNGCDYDHFSTVQGRKRPRGWVEGRPVVGYAGVVAAWFNWDAVLETATTLPNAIIWVIGSCHTEIPSVLPDNVVLEGFVPYESLPEYYAGFDLAMVPFKGDLLLKGVSPIKLYEYLAAGKPVVASSLPDAVSLRSEGIVEVADNPKEFAQTCAHVLSGDSNRGLAMERQRIARGHSWAARWGLCESLIFRQVASECVGD